jgi:hypothetical protein
MFNYLNFLTFNNFLLTMQNLIIPQPEFIRKYQKVCRI